MEVHAHSHSSPATGGATRKKWTHYFWEFLMLFLAVFCGFLAEYQLEHKIEKERERQYMQGLLEDLHTDTATIKSAFELGNRQKLLYDTLLSVANKAALNLPDISLLYLLSSNSTRVVYVGFETRTMSQLKNSGGMRLIRKKMVGDSILRYWQNMESCNNIGDRLERISDWRHSVSVQLFHNKFFIRKEGLVSVVSAIKEGCILISNDPALMAEYSNRTYSNKLVLINYMVKMTEAKQRAVRLMEVIRDNYHL